MFKDILITSTKEKTYPLTSFSSSLKKKIKNNAFRLVFIPTIKITPIKDWRQFHNNIKKLDFIDVILLTSQHSANFFLHKIKELHLQEKIKKKKILVVGKKTKNMVEKFSYFNVLLPKKENTTGILEFIQQKKLAQSFFWFPCSNLSNKKIADFLKQQGGKILQNIIYYNDFPLTSKKNCKNIS